MWVEREALTTMLEEHAPVVELVGQSHPHITIHITKSNKHDPI